jgi:hypothetical protein
MQSMNGTSNGVDDRLSICTWQRALSNIPSSVTRTPP